MTVIGPWSAHSVFLTPKVLKAEEMTGRRDGLMLDPLTEVVPVLLNLKGVCANGRFLSRVPSADEGAADSLASRSWRPRNTPGLSPPSADGPGRFAGVQSADTGSGRATLASCAGFTARRVRTSRSTCSPSERRSAPLGM